MTQLLIPPGDPLAGPNTGLGTDGGDLWSITVSKINNFFQQTGVTTVNFGVAPGSTDTTTTITGQTTIVAGSTVDAWVIAAPTADHSADEHWVDGPKITAGNIVPGVGFTIYAETQGPSGGAPDTPLGSLQYGNTQTGSPLTYGAWTVAWQWA
jgi:hypothetical protein